MLIIELLKVVLLGIVEGITEWLPISSTGHMILVEQFIELNTSEVFKEMFFVVIQLGAILAVVLLYFHKLNPFSANKSWKEKKETISIWCKVVVGVIPAGVLGVLVTLHIRRLFDWDVSGVILDSRNITFRCYYYRWDYIRNFSSYGY